MARDDSRTAETATIEGAMDGTFLHDNHGVTIDTIVAVAHGSGIAATEDVVMDLDEAIGHALIAEDNARVAKHFSILTLAATKDILDTCGGEVLDVDRGREVGRETVGMGGVVAGIATAAEDDVDFLCVGTGGRVVIVDIDGDGAVDVTCGVVATKEGVDAATEDVDSDVTVDVGLVGTAEDARHLTTLDGEGEVDGIQLCAEGCRVGAAVDVAKETGAALDDEVTAATGCVVTTVEDVAHHLVAGGLAVGALVVEGE